MKLIKIKIMAATAMILGILVLTMSDKAFAQTGPEAECICTERCKEGKVNENCPVCSKDITLCQGVDEPEETVEETEPQETMGPLTPDGNMNLIDDYGSPDKTGKQFITMTTKNGNYFYLIIDRDDSGNETVHFLNLVDEADLLKLLDDDEKKAYEEELAKKEEERLAAEQETEPETEAPAEEEKPVKKGLQPPNPAVLLLILAGVLGGIGLYLYKKIQVKKPTKSKADPDIDYSEQDKDDEEDYLDTIQNEDRTGNKEDTMDESVN